MEQTLNHSLTFGRSFSLFIVLVPISWLIISLTFLKMQAYKVCIIGLALSIASAIGVWQMPYMLAIKAVLEGAILALLPIVWVIFAAFFTYNLSVHTGAMDSIRKMMSNLSSDRRIQGLAIAWGFGGFLEATAGFGTAVAIPASILISLGFEPFFAAIICLLANTVAVAFGVVGIPVTTLAKITELPVMALAHDIVLQLTPFALIVPFLIVFAITKSLKGFCGIWLTTLAAGISFAGSQFLIAKYIGPELPAILGSFISFITIIVCAKIFSPAREWHFPNEDQELKIGVQANNSSFGNRKEQIIAWSPYILLLILVLGTSKLVPEINQTLSQVKSVFLIYDGAGGKPLYIDWILTPGTLIMLAAIIGGLIQGASWHNFKEIFMDTAGHLRKTTVTVVAIVSMAKVLAYSGMVGFLALRLAETTGIYYPLFAPLIGALGTFITGSDTSANILFGLLQKQTAMQIGADPVWIAAANTSGACAGKIISPQSIAIVATAAGLVGKEGEILTTAFKYVGVFILGLGVLTYTFAY